MSEYTPITGELRNSMTYDITTASDGVSMASIGIMEFNDLCSDIDSVHTALEAENERLRQDLAICSESEQEKCIGYLRKENIDWEDKYLHVAMENAKLREQIDTLVMYVESDGTKYSVDCYGHQHFDHSDMCVPDGWIELPKDKDGEYIHIGYEVETTNFGTVEVEGFVHRAVAFYNYSEQPAYLCTTPANLCHRHHAQTVEDLLREMADRCYADEDEPRDRDAIVAEYAAKLRLAGEDE